MIQKQINQTSPLVRAAIQRKTAAMLPDRPTQLGFKPADIRKALYEAIISESGGESLMSELDRIVREVNEALGSMATESGEVTVLAKDWNGSDGTPYTALIPIGSVISAGDLVLLTPADDATKEAAAAARLTMRIGGTVDGAMDYVVFARPQEGTAPGIDMTFRFCVIRTTSSKPAAVALIGVDAVGEGGTGGTGTGAGVDEEAVNALISAALGDYLSEEESDARYAQKEEIPTVPVQSVNGKTGAVSLTASDVGARASTWTPGKSEVGLGNVDNVRQYSESNPPPYPVKSVNGLTGAVVLTAALLGVYTKTEVDTLDATLRDLIQALTERLNALANSDDTTLDDLKEVVAYIKSNRTLIESVTTSKVSVVDIIDNLVTNVTTKPLSAAQGVAIKKLIDALSTDKLDASALTAAKLAEVLGYTPAKPSDIPTVPQALPNPYALSILGKVYSGSEAVSLTVDEIIEAIKTASGGVVAWIGDDNNIYLSGNLADGTYKAYYEVDGEYIEIGDLTLGEEETEKPVEPVTESIALTKDVSLVVGTGEDRANSTAYLVTEWIDVSDVPRPCTIDLSGAGWAYANASDTGLVRFHVNDMNGNKLAGDYTHYSKMPAGVSMVYNTEDRQSVTVTVTSDAVGSLRFSGIYGNHSLGNGTGNFDDAKVTLTYTPAS